MPFDGIGYERRIEALGDIDKVIDLLGDRNRWCKRQLQTPDGRYCVLGALRAAGAELVLKEPILLAIKQVTGRSERRIEHFNDDPQTTHALVMRVLRQARENILTEAVPATQPAPGLWARVCQVFA